MFRQPDCRRRITFFLSTAIFLLISLPAAGAEMTTFSEEYTYPASRLDNRESARIMALEGVKDLLWSRLRAHIETLTEVRNLELTSDWISTLVPVLAPLDGIRETWQGRTCRIRAGMSVSSRPETIAQTLKALVADPFMTKELSDIRKKRELILKKVADKKKATPKTYRPLVRELRALDGFIRGCIAENSGNWPEAKKAFDGALTFDRKNSSAFYHRGLARLRTGDKRGAVRDFTTTVSLNPGNDRAYYLRGLVFAGERKDREAAADFTRAIKINGGFVQAYIQRGRVLERSGKLQEALNDLSLAIELEPGNAQTYLHRGAVHSKLGREREAKMDFARAVRLDQKQILSQAPSAAVPENDLKSLGDMDLTIARDPGNAEAYYRRGMLYDSMGNHQQALSDFSKSIELDPRNAAAYFMRGLVYGMIDIQADSISDMKISARLGYKPAQDYMSAKGMAW